MSDVVAKYKNEYALMIAGYIKQHSMIFDTDIPREICFIIYEFYQKIDEWDTESINKSTFTIHTDKRTLTYSTSNDYEWKSAFGRIQIKPIDYIPWDSDSKDAIIHSWKVKIIKQNTGAIIIGVTSGNKDSDELYTHMGGSGLYTRDGDTYGSHSVEPTMDITFNQGETAEIVLLFKKMFYYVRFRKNIKL